MFLVYHLRGAAFWHHSSPTTLPFVRLRLLSSAWQPGAGQATKDWAEILHANPGRAMLNWCRHNAQCLPVWKQSGPMLSAGCANVGPSWALRLSWAYVGPSRAHVEPCWAHLGPMLGQVEPILSYVVLILGPCWAYVGPMLAYVGPMLAHVEPSWELCWGHVWAIYVETILRCQFVLLSKNVSIFTYVYICVHLYMYMHMHMHMYLYFM